VRDLVVIMGVAGSGKTTTGEALSAATGWPFIEADAHHSEANRAKMTAGTPLSDADRVDWVASIARAVQAAPEDRLVLACSALTPFVQAALQDQCGRQVHFVWLDVPESLLAERMKTRPGHFMPVSLLRSQLDALTVPEAALCMDGTLPLANLIGAIQQALPPFESQS